MHCVRRCDHKYSTHGFLVSNIFREIRQTEASNLEWSEQTHSMYVKHVTRIYTTQAYRRATKPIILANEQCVKFRTARNDLCAVVISPFLLNCKLYKLNLNRSFCRSSTIEKIRRDAHVPREHHCRIFPTTRWIANRKVSFRSIVRVDGLMKRSYIWRCTRFTKHLHFPARFAHVRKKNASVISEYSLTISTRWVSLAHRFPLFDERKVARDPSSSRCTSSRNMQFSNVESGSLFSLSLSFSLFSSSRAENAISFNFQAMRMKHGALRGFEGANAANRYATSNSGPSECKQRERKRQRERTNGEKDERKKGGDSFILVLEKKTKDPSQNPWKWRNR